MSRPPVVVHLLEYFARGGGAEGQLRMLAGDLADAGFDTRIWYYKDPPGRLGRSSLDDSVARKIEGHQRGALPFVWRLRRELRASGCSLLHTWMSSANIYGRLAGLLAGGLPMVSSERTAPKGRAQVWADRVLGRLSSRVIANSRGVRRFLAEEEGIPAAKLVVIPNGVDTDIFRPRDPHGLRRELGLPDKTVLLGTVGRHIADKRQEWLLQVVADLRAREMPVEGVLAGWGARQEALERQAADLGITAQIHFLGMRDDVPHILSGLDVFLLPSVREGMPNAVLEAMACGVACVATDVSGVSDLLADGVSPAGAVGSVVAVPDQAGFLAAVERFARSPEARAATGAAARRRVEDLFSRRAMVAAYVDLYRSVLAERQR